MSMIEETIAKLAHAGQKYGKGDYFTNHIEKVVANLPTDATYLHAGVAYLHDVLEDTAVTTGMLVDFGVSNEVIGAVVVLTRLEGTDYMDYIREVVRHPVARVVKVADLKANLANNPRPSLRKRYEVALTMVGF